MFFFYLHFHIIVNHIRQCHLKAQKSTIYNFWDTICLVKHGSVAETNVFQRKIIQDSEEEEEIYGDRLIFDV